MQLLEQLFKKVQTNYGIDKVKLIKSLLEREVGAHGHPSKNILQGLTKKDKDESVKDNSID